MAACCRRRARSYSEHRRRFEILTVWSPPGRHTSVGLGAPERDGWISSDWGFAALIAAVANYYLFLLSNGTFRLFAPEMLDKAFDNILIHLLHGEVAVDREAIDFEAFTHNGKTYTYFGVFPALLRLFALPLVDIAQVPLARLSCLTAVVFYVPCSCGWW